MAQRPDFLWCYEPCYNPSQPAAADANALVSPVIDPSFRTVFPTGETGSVTDSAYATQPELVSQIESRLRSLDVAGAAQTADRLKAAPEAALGTYARLDEARRAYRTARGVELLKDRVRDVLAPSEGALLQSLKAI